MASKFDLDLEEVAQGNLAKCRDRWGAKASGHHSHESAAVAFDDAFPSHERIPRRFEAELTTVRDGESVKMRVFVNGRRMGQDLTDNARRDDGYRCHDVFHLACAAVLGWSPVVRRNLGLKRRSDRKTDEVEDGGRAIVIEEGITAMVFSYAKSHAMLEGVPSVDCELLKTIEDMTRHLEVSVRSLHDWERTILMAYEVWRKVERNGGGIVIMDLDERLIRFKD